MHARRMLQELRETSPCVAMKYRAKAVRTEYWTPRVDYVNTIVRSVGCYVADGDILTISEKAISTAQGRLVDESRIKPSLMAKVIAQFWMRVVWGYLLGVLCRMSQENIERMRSYPLPQGAAHKELALRLVGLPQTLRHGSEGGIDVSNVPYSYAALPLEKPMEEAEKILKAVQERTGKNVAVMIVDSDKTYSAHGIHLTPRPNPIKGILSLGLAAYAIGRRLKWTPRSTPLAIVGADLTVDEALRVAAVANKARGYGAGRTAWDMAERFRVGLTEVTWEMLSSMLHYPIVIVRRRPL